MTGITISSIRNVDCTIRWLCCAATEPDGFSNTLLQPDSNAAVRISTSVVILES